jgi:hypothetical protein
MSYAELQFMNTVYSGKEINVVYVKVIPLQRCPYFDVVVGFVWSHDPESYAGGGI